MYIILDEIIQDLFVEQLLQQESIILLKIVSRIDFG